MVERKAEATWKGDLSRGNGRFRSGTVEGSYSAASRFEDGDGSNPEELIGAALASCFAMALSNILDGAGHTPSSVHAEATVHLDPGGPAVTRIELRVEGEVPGVDADAFRSHAETAKANCPISKALGAVDIELVEAELA